ncbi:hypothetical protein, partial [Bacillus sp. SIMBA_005]|uniref:hypothetical protein n=1 Tax=Bacillus sp. SIMBA_005 TaxID=3085754 RepID=UPI00397D5C2A
DEHDGLDPAFLDAEGARDGFLEVIRHNTQVPGLVALFSRLAVDAADPAHPAHDYFLERSERLRSSIAESFTNDDQRPTLDPDTLA